VLRNPEFEKIYKIKLKALDENEQPQATQIRPGMVLQHENELYTVFSTDHRTPGNKRGSMQNSLKESAHRHDD